MLPLYRREYSFVVLPHHNKMLSHSTVILKTNGKMNTIICRLAVTSNSIGTTSWVDYPLIGRLGSNKRDRLSSGKCQLIAHIARHVFVEQCETGLTFLARIHYLHGNSIASVVFRGIATDDGNTSPSPTVLAV